MKLSSLKNTAKTHEYNIASRRRKTKNVASEIEPNDKTTMKNTTEKTASTAAVLEIPAVERVRTLMTKTKPFVYSSSDEELTHQLPSVYTETLTETFEVRRFCVKSCHRSPYFNDSTTVAEYNQFPFLNRFSFRKTFELVRNR